MNDQFLDIRVPIKLLLSNWQRVTVVALAAAAIAIAITLLLPRTYAAQSTLAITPSRVEVQLDDRIRSLSDYELMSGTFILRKESMVALVTSNEVVQALLQSVGDRLEPEEREIVFLRELVSVRTSGDLINLTIEFRDPELAALLANEWAKQYEQHVNQVYSERNLPAASTINQQVESAAESYHTSQAALERFLAEDPIEQLQRELDARLALLENYQNTRISVQSLPADRNTRVLQSHFLELAHIETWLSDAEALREQVSLGSDSAAASTGNALALISLRNRIFGGGQWTSWAQSNESGNNSLPALEFDISSLTEENVAVSDIDDLITVLERRRAAAQARIQTFLDGLQNVETTNESTVLDRRIAELASEANTLESQIEAANAQLLTLQSDRDRAWETYQVLLSRQVEEQISSETLSTDVRIADTAVVPSEPTPRGLVRNTLIAMIIGSLLASSFIMVRAWWVSAAGEQVDIPARASNRDEEN